MRSRLVVVILIFILSVALGALAYFKYTHETYWPASVSAPNERYDLPLIIAHKALGAKAPPSTLAAVQEHLRGDIGGIELDVRTTADGVAVIFHEDQLQPFTDCAGPVEKISWEQLSRCRYATPTKPGIARLDQVLKTVAGKKRIFLDTKEHTIRDSGLADALISTLDREDAFANTIIESFNPFFLYRMRQKDTRARLLFDFTDDAEARKEESPEQLAQIPWMLKQEPIRWLIREIIRPDYLGPRFSVNPRTIRRLSNIGYPLIAWTIDDPAEALRLYSLGANAVQTNNPFGLTQALKTSSLRKIDDASGLNATYVADVLRPLKIEDVQNAFQIARENGLRLSIAGRRHSMGRQAFATGQLVLDMTAMRGVQYDPTTGLVNAQAGATWLDVQRVLDQHGRSVIVMQSDNIFTVGGSLGVNAHGWQVASGPLSSTVEDLTIVLPNSEIKTASRKQNQELLAAALGGYGGLGVIVNARLRTAPNQMYVKRSWYVAVDRLPQMMKEKIIDNRKAQLAYGRLSVDSKNFLTQAAVHVYETAAVQPKTLPKMSHESLVGLKRQIFRASERGDFGKAQRWLLERRIGGALESGPISRNSIMGPDIHVLWPASVTNKDILHEYFIPRGEIKRFIDGLRLRVKKRPVNLLNVTLRDVRRDDLTLLRYAPDDRIALVLFFSQGPGPAVEAQMAALTQELVQLSIGLGGSFYLPYRTHYSKEQFQKAYPGWAQYARTRRRYDPEGLIWSGFLQHIGG